MSGDKEHWTKRAWQGLLLLVVIAIGARVVYGLLAPLLPLLGVVTVLIALYILLFHRRH